MLFTLNWGHPLCSQCIIQEMNICKMLDNSIKEPNRKFYRWIFWKEINTISPNQFLKIAKQSNTDAGLSSKQNNKAGKCIECDNSKARTNFYMQNY